MRKTMQSNGDEWSLNYELRRLGMHGGGGVGNSQGLEASSRAADVQSRRRRAVEEGRVRRAVCEGEGRQIVPEESRSVQMEEQNYFVEVDWTGYRLFPLRQQPANLVASQHQEAQLEEVPKQDQKLENERGVCTRDRICEECRKSVVRMTLLHLFEETGMQFC